MGKAYVHQHAFVIYVIRGGGAMYSAGVLSKDNRFASSNMVPSENKGYLKSSWTRMNCARGSRNSMYCLISFGSGISNVNAAESEESSAGPNYS